MQAETGDPVNIQLHLPDFSPDDPRTEALSLALQQLVIRGTPIILHLRDFGGQVDKGPIVSLASPDLPTITLDSLAESIGNKLRAGATQGNLL